ncbi:MAG: glucose-6-phosphate isomerase [Gammaproteobacteria bacterium]
MVELTNTSEWQDLVSHQHSLHTVHLQALFAQDENRFDHFSLSTLGLLCDFSKNIITEETLSLLIKLAKRCELQEKISDLFEGKKVNTTEQRAELHTALRQQAFDVLNINQKNIIPELVDERERLIKFSKKIHQQEKLGFTKKPITDIVNIGMGGSDLGVKLLVNALKNYRLPNMRCHFIADIDPSPVEDLLSQLNPETTLFIVVSKSFSTTETMINALHVKTWLENKLKSIEAFFHHFVAVTSNLRAAFEFGFEPDQVFSLLNDVAGRFSLWSNVGMALMLMIGHEQFLRLLEGAYQLDQHFKNTDFRNNIPVILALLSIWYNNFNAMTTQAILPYNEALQFLPAYIQQLAMESNGKSITIDEKIVDYKTAQVIWGSLGNPAQHAFMQLLHQGTNVIPVDFILAGECEENPGFQTQMLWANCLAQSKCLAFGSEDGEFKQPIYKTLTGNRPSNTIILPEISPYYLGALLAIYEHKVFVEGVIWQINSFDQWGVEHGKKIAKTILNDLTRIDNTQMQDSSTMGLMQFLRKVK